jgi:hypothetical protein
VTELPIDPPAETREERESRERWEAVDDALKAFVAECDKAIFDTDARRSGNTLYWALVKADRTFGRKPEAVMLLCDSILAAFDGLPLASRREMWCMVDCVEMLIDLAKKRVGGGL